MLTVAEKYFGFNPDGQKLVSVCGDAYEYVNKSADKGSYDIVIVDINYTDEDKSISPPWKFLETEFLQKISDLAKPVNAFIGLNILYYSEVAREKVEANLKQIQNIDNITKLNVEGYANNAIMLTRRDEKIATSDLLAEPKANAKVLEQMLKDWNVANRALWLKESEMGDHMESFEEIK